MTKELQTLSEQQWQGMVERMARLFGWTVYVNDSGGASDPGEVVVECELDVAPTTKLRPRFSKSGKVYSAARQRAAEHQIGWMLRNECSEPNTVDDLAVFAEFRTATRQRRDLDNMLKLLLDAANGVVWRDDQQVVKIDASVSRGHANPGISLRVEVVESRRRDCVECDTRLTDKQIRLGYEFCSHACYSVSQRHRKRLDNGSYEKQEGNTCDDCGVPLKDKRSVRCRNCWKYRRAGSPDAGLDIELRSEPGFPDLVLVRDGMLIFAELKTDTGKLTQHQRKWMAALDRADVPVYVWRPHQYEEVRDTLERREGVR